MELRRARLCILVKAYPQPSQQYEETVCCAGISAEGELLRLYPIPYRRLDKEQQFDRFDIIEADIFRDTSDHRIESHKVEPGSIRIITPGKKLQDISKVELWAPFVVESITALKEENRATQRSLGIVKPDAGSLKFFWRSIEGDDESMEIFKALKSQAGLFATDALPSLQPEFSFGYKFESAGHRHEMKIHDWEVQAAYASYKRRYGKEALDRLGVEYGQRIPASNLHFILGTMKAHPRQFIIIGLLRSQVSPDDATRQESLFG